MPAVPETGVDGEVQRDGNGARSGGDRRSCLARRRPGSRVARRPRGHGCRWLVPPLSRVQTDTSRRLKVEKINSCWEKAC